MRNQVRYTVAGLLLAATLMLSTAFSLAAPDSITSKEFLSLLYDLTGCESMEELVEQHYINKTEANILNTKYPYASMVQRVLPPLFGVYPYPHQLYPDHPHWSVGGDIYVDAAVALWSMGWEPRTYYYTLQEVQDMITFLRTHKLTPPINSEFDVDITHESYRARNALILAWGKIPQKHKDYLEDNGWRIEYHTTMSEASGTNWNTCSGVTSYADKLIYLFDCNEDTVYHEMGHAITKLGDTDFLHPTLYNLEAKRGQKFMREYAMTSPNEFVACAFSEYFSDPASLKRYCPLTYTYIDRVFYDCDYACDVYFVKQLKESPVATLVKEALIP